MGGAAFEERWRDVEGEVDYLLRSFKTLAERLWLLMHAWDRRNPKLGHFPEFSLEQLNEGSAGPVLGNRIRVGSRNALFWYFWTARYGSALNAVLNFKAVKAPTADFARRTLLILHLRECVECGFRGIRLSDSQLAVISLLDGNWPEGRRVPRGGFTVSEIVWAEAGAIKMARRRLKAQNWVRTTRKQRT
jgi:hypothetical protein